MERFLDRTEAGKLLADQLRKYANRFDVIVLALPRGGVPVGFEIAQALKAPLDVFLVRKLGVPGHEELAMGAIAMGNIRVLNDNVLRSLSISKEDIEAVAQEEQQELERRNKRYRPGKLPLDVKNKIVILVDDGLATGATMKAAVMAIKKMQPAKIIIAVPVAAQDAYRQFKGLVEEIVCLLTPPMFYSISQWYESFPQTSDEEVLELLALANQS